MRSSLVVGCCLAALGFVLAAVTRGAIGASTALVSGEGSTPAQLTAGSVETHHYEYVFQPGQMYIYDIDNGLQQVRHVSGLPDTDGVRGVMVDPAAHTLYISHGGDGPEGSSHGFLLAYDLVSESVLWNREYAFPVDSGAITPDGTKIYMPSGENSASGIWNVLRASDGAPIGSIQGGVNAHNTIVSLDGTKVFMAGRNSEYLFVASTATDQVIQKIGPLNYGVRPFTVNGSDTLAYTTATHFLGFQVSSIATGKVLYTVPVPGFSLPAEYTGPPSHGISLAPDEQRLYVMDAPNDYVHVFDVSGLPASAPRLLASIKLSPRSGEENPCAYDCEKSGWLQASRDGRYVFVGDTGDVIDTSTLAIARTLAPLAETRQMLEVDWAAGMPTATTSRYGLGYVTGAGSSSLTSPAPSMGLGGAAPPPGTTPGGPVIDGLSISPSAFRSKQARGAIAPRRSSVAAWIRYRESEAALSTFTVLEGLSGVEEGSRHRCVATRNRARLRRRRCVRYVVVGHFTHRDRAGANSLGFTGSLGAHRLAPARYRLRVASSAAGRVGAARTAAFRILP